jgi:hypothetical protein
MRRVGLVRRETDVKDMHSTRRVGSVRRETGTITPARSGGAGWREHSSSHARELSAVMPRRSKIAASSRDIAASPGIRPSASACTTRACGDVCGPGSAGPAVINRGGAGPTPLSHRGGPAVIDWGFA